MENRRTACSTAILGILALLILIAWSVPVFA